MFKLERILRFSWMHTYTTKLPVHATCCNYGLRNPFPHPTISYTSGYPKVTLDHFLLFCVVMLIIPTASCLQLAIIVIVASRFPYKMTTRRHDWTCGRPWPPNKSQFPVSMLLPDSQAVHTASSPMALSDGNGEARISDNSVVGEWRYESWSITNAGAWDWSRLTVRAGASRMLLFDATFVDWGIL